MLITTDAGTCAVYALGEKNAVQFKLAGGRSFRLIGWFTKREAEERACQVALDHPDLPYFLNNKAEWA